MIDNDILDNQPKNEIQEIATDDNVLNDTEEINPEKINSLCEEIIIDDDQSKMEDLDQSNVYNKTYTSCNTNINHLTFEYFSNSNAYNKYLNKQKFEKINTNSDKKFYKKRILDLTRKMLKGEFENESLKDNFNTYIFSLISHFKIMDTTEIIQKTFDSSDSTNTPDILDNSFVIITDISLSNPNQLLYKKDTKTLTMDNFINKKQKEREQPNFPLKKNINLREPEFKIKGIKKKEKKENIDNV